MRIACVEGLWPGGQRQKGGQDCRILAQLEEGVTIRCNRNGSSRDCGIICERFNRSQDGCTGGLEGRIGMIERVRCGAVAGRGRDRGQGSGRPKSEQGNMSWVKGTVQIVQRGVVGAELQTIRITGEVRWEE